MSTKLVKAGILVSLKSIRTPDNFAALLAEPRVKRLAASIKSVSQIAPIVLEAISDGVYKLWAGHDRFAAVTLAGKQTIRADIRTGSEADFLLLQIAENDSRRHRAELIDAFEEGATKSGSVAPAQRVRARADADLAAAQGVTPRAVKKARQRKAKAAKESAAGANGDRLLSSEPAGAAAEPAFIYNLEVYGCRDASTEAVCNFARPVQAAIDDCDRLLRQALAALKPIEMSGRGQELRAEVHRVGDFVRSERPHAICPYCKGLPKATIGYCNACNGIGYVSEEKAARAPRECREADPPIVLVNGQEYHYADALAGKVPKNGAPNGTPAKGEKRVRVEDGETGDELF